MLIAVSTPPLTEAMAVAVPVPSTNVRLGIESRVGGWLTGVTTTVKVRWNVLLPPPAVLPLFITVTVITAVPLVNGAGV